MDDENAGRREDRKARLGKGRGKRNDCDNGDHEEEERREKRRRNTGKPPKISLPIVSMKQEEDDAIYISSESGSDTEPPMTQTTTSRLWKENRTIYELLDKIQQVIRHLLQTFRTSPAERT